MVTLVPPTSHPPYDLEVREMRAESGSVNWSALCVSSDVSYVASMWADWSFYIRIIPFSICFSPNSRRVNSLNCRPHPKREVESDLLALMASLWVELTNV